MSRRKERLKIKKRDLHNFLHATELCKDVYSHEEWYKEAGLTRDIDSYFDLHNEFIEIETTEMIVGMSSKQPERLYIMFRGSDEKGDWKINLNPFPIPLRKISNRFTKRGLKGRISRGFGKEYAGLDGYPGYRDAVQQIVKKHNAKEVWFIGHSNGGPKAALCWAETVCAGIVEKCHCYQLSGPRWARMSTHRDFEALSENPNHFCGIIQCGLDPVPMVGPALLGWRHVGKFYHVGLLRPTLFPAKNSNHAPHVLMRYIDKRLQRKAYQRV
jgi:hypothetical protein